MIADEKVFRRALYDDQTLLRISPGLFFQILLSKAAQDLRDISYTIEKNSAMRIPVFDTREVVELLDNRAVLAYLADMLSSFTKAGSHAIHLRAGKRIWRKIRFSDMDIHDLINLCEAVDDEHRLGIYKRVADICLFILGVFPDYAERDCRYPWSGQQRPRLHRRRRTTPEEYETAGRRFYKLAAQHRSARQSRAAEIFRILHGSFQEAKKPLNFIAEHYLQHSRHRPFH